MIILPICTPDQEASGRGEPPHFYWSMLMFRQRRTTNGKQASEAGVREPSDPLLDRIKLVHDRINDAKVKIGSQYTALEFAADAITDISDQTILGFDAIDRLQFTSEASILAKNQLMNQVALAMLTQANNAQKGLLDLVAGS